MKKHIESGMRGDTTKSKIRRRISSLGHGLLVLASVVGGGCAGEDETAVTDRTQDEIDLGVTLEGLGTKFDSCARANLNGATDFVASTKVLTVTLSANTDAVLSVVNGKIKVNGWQCATDPTATPAGVDLTTTNVTKIIFAGAASTNKIVLDMLPGSFGNMLTGTGGIIIQGTGMSVGVRGTGLANTFKVGQEGSAATGPFYFELSGDTRADVKIEGNPGAMSFALGDGNDTFTAQGQALTTSPLGGSTVTGDLATENISVFGGLGNDTIKGGLGDDTLNGGEGNDWFTSSAGSIDDGADLFIGGTGTDTVDYGARTVAVSASIAPTYAKGWLEGVDLTNATVAANATLAITVNGSATPGVTFGGTPTVGTTAILAAINGAAGINSTASVNDRGELVLQASTASQSIAVTAASAGTTLFGGAKSNNGVSQLTLDPDDGISGEGDDIQADVENLIGGSGNDYLSGSSGSNTISGGAGDDDISGGPAGSSCSADVDVLNGNDGNDIFRLGTLTNCGDAVDGGNGTDKASYELRGVAVSVTIDTTANDGEDQEADKILSTVEIILGSSQDDTLTGGTGNDEIHGGGGADIINGGAGNDTIVGSTGADFIEGGGGADSLVGGAGTDTLFGDAGDDTIEGGIGDDTLDGAAGTNSLIGGGGDDICTVGAAGVADSTCEL
jgi:Ca2+-binding RTX toxin-like protein